MDTQLFNKIATSLTPLLVTLIPLVTSYFRKRGKSKTDILELQLKEIYAPIYRHIRMGYSSENMNAIHVIIYEHLYIVPFDIIDSFDSLSKKLQSNEKDTVNVNVDKERFEKKIKTALNFIRHQLGYSKEKLSGEDKAILAAYKGQFWTKVKMVLGLLAAGIILLFALAMIITGIQQSPPEYQWFLIIFSIVCIGISAYQAFKK